MVQFALLAAFVLPQKAPPPDINVWYCPYIDVTGYSTLDDSGGHHYDIRDAFGGTFGNMPHEQGHVVFEDATGGPSTPDFIEWTTKEPVAIKRLVFSWKDDAPGSNWRNLGHFWIYGRRTASEPWKMLWQENTPSSVGKYTMEKKIPEETCQLFRAEFIRNGASELSAVGPRIVDIEAYGRMIKSQ